jgi:hypothetical protein
MSLRAKIRSALIIQETIEGSTPNIEACRVVLDSIDTDTEWQALTDCRHHRYGVLSYEAHRFYYLKDWVLPMVKNLQETIK